MNPSAGTGAAAADLAADVRRRKGAVVRETTSPEDIGAFTREALDQNAARLVVAGGDGTVHHVIRALAPDFGRIALGIVPLGTGNDLARALGLSAEPVAALEHALTGATRPIDLVRVTEQGAVAPARWMINAAYAGFGGYTGEDLDAAHKQRLGSLVYWLDAAERLFDLPVYRLEAELDGATANFDIHGLTVGNGRFIGGGMPVAPDAEVDDGRLDVTLVPTQPLPSAIVAALDVVRGRQAESDRLHAVRVRRAVLRSTPPLEFTLDGEPYQLTAPELEVLPGAVRIVAGPQPSCFSDGSGGAETKPVGAQDDRSA